MATLETITVRRLKEVLDYDPMTGLFIWRQVPGRWRSYVKDGDTAGGWNRSGRCWMIRIDGRLYCAHRLAWLYVYGELPSIELDHINHDPGDNRIANLREATSSQNKANRPAQKNNTSGYKGVTRERNGWMAQIQYRGRNHRIGNFKSRKEAYAAYCLAAKRFFGQFARG